MGGERPQVPQLRRSRSITDPVPVERHPFAGDERFDVFDPDGEGVFFTDNEWEGRIGESGPTLQSNDSSTTVIPTGSDTC